MKIAKITIHLFAFLCLSNWVFAQKANSENIMLHGITIGEEGIFTTSDRNNKKSIKTLESALTKVMNLRGISYIISEEPAKGVQIGVIGQEVDNVYPELVNTCEEGIKSVNYAHMVAVLIEAIKELNTKVNSLERDNINLTKENIELKASLDKEMKQFQKRLENLEKFINGPHASNAEL